MADYTPTTNGMRNRYLWWYEAQKDRSPRRFNKYPDEVLAEFDRWFAEANARSGAAALRRMANRWREEGIGVEGFYDPSYPSALEAEAEMLEREP